MQIPLDYYRILGVPIQANEELFSQAYNDRCLQLPRQEYSQYAIITRKFLLEEAYEVLSDTQKRNDYNDKFFKNIYPESTTIEIEKQHEIQNRVEDDIETKLTDNEEEKLDLKQSSDIYAPYLEISEDLFIGALLILQDLGEYELVLNLGKPYLNGQKKLESLENNHEELENIWHDLILTITLAYIELGREQWQLGEYEAASSSQEKGYQLLVKENLFTNLQEEIRNDLYKLRPYLIVEILEKKNANISSRKKALNLIQDILDERGGIEGKETDKSGLDLDNFLRFIQQIRVDLTVEEQQKLFEREAQRPSAAASYLAVYALIARGFSERKPAFIVRAKNILISLTQHQDVYLEQALCALFLGQTEEAEFACSQSQEEQSIKFIKEHSVGSPDLLPGLCLYGEKWLQTEVFSQFSNLENQTSSLKEYFADREVQSYLEKLFIEPSETQDNSLSESDFKNLSSQELENNTNNNQFTEVDLLQNSPDLLNQNDFDVSVLKNNPNENETDFNSEEENSDSKILTLKEAERDLEISENDEELVSFDSFLDSKIEDSPPENNISHNEKVNVVLTDNQELKSANKLESELPEISEEEEKKSSSFSGKLWLLILLLLVFLGSIVTMIILIYNFLSNQKEEKLILSISKPIIEISKPESSKFEPPKSENILDKTLALKVVRDWLSAKVKATGPQYEINELNEILTEPLLSRWRGNAITLRNKNAYYNYEHTQSIEDIVVKNPNEATVEAIVNENAKYYKDGQLNVSQSYHEKLTVQYELVKENDKWLIKDVKVENIEKIN